ncbi:hypothetical protein [Mycobacterium sp. 050134]|uniref:hypothetical protein n=1 Tax=Mycobacterium sp. 050134 TaxID=3096111 RepID=UPI002EDB0921
MAIRYGIDLALAYVIGLLDASAILIPLGRHAAVAFPARNVIVVLLLGPLGAAIDRASESERAHWTERYSTVLRGRSELTHVCAPTGPATS